MIAHTDYPFRTVNISSFHRSFRLAEIKHNLVSLKNLAHAEREANAILNDFHPDLIVGTGGYASYPLVRYGAKAGIPTAVHESNIVPGLTTRQLEPHCDRIMVGFEDCRAHYKHPEKGGRDRYARARRLLHDQQAAGEGKARHERRAQAHRLVLGQPRVERDEPRDGGVSGA